MFIRINSHRARRKVKSALGHAPAAYFQWTGGYWYEIADEEWPKVETIAGVSRSRIQDQSKLCRCWT